MQTFFGTFIYWRPNSSNNSHPEVKTEVEPSEKGDAESRATKNEGVLADKLASTKIT